MCGSSQRMKNYIIETLYMMGRSATYMTLAPAPSELEDFTISLLEAEYARIQHQLQDDMEQRGPRSRIDCTHEIDAPQDIERLLRHEPVRFAFSFDAPGEFPVDEHPLIESVEIALLGLREQERNVVISLRQAGFSFARSAQTGRVFSFTHHPRKVNYQYSLATGRHHPHSGDLTEQGRYLPVSPFAAWSLTIPAGGPNARVDLTGLRGVRLIFRVRTDPA
jgi:hypothetical protein